MAFLKNILYTQDLRMRMGHLSIGAVVLNKVEEAIVLSYYLGGINKIMCIQVEM